mmetsp:Transcript_7175/g.10983  ORF Transcript_7175/g.10983 Transcript_7175/m.10983 type:complete len:212 (-) Transcript_7175:479-1114(-)
MLLGAGCQVSCHHFLDHGLESVGGFPTQLGLDFGGVPVQQVNFCWAEILGVDFDQNAAVLVFTYFIHTFTFPCNGQPNLSEGQFDKLADSCSFTHTDNKIFGFVGLHDHPHCFNIVLSVTPVTLGVHVAKVQTFLFAKLNVCDGSGGLPSNKGGATPRALVVKQNTVDSEHIVSFAEVDHDPEGVLLCNSVGRPGVERSCFGLRYFTDFPV